MEDHQHIKTEASVGLANIYILRLIPYYFSYWSVFFSVVKFCLEDELFIVRLNIIVNYKVYMFHLQT